jgi:hypothetical protein
MQPTIKIAAGSAVLIIFHMGLVSFHRDALVTG